MARKEDNLNPFTSEQSREKAKINGAKGGKASGEAKRRKRDLRLALEALLESDVKKKDLSGKEQDMSVAEAISLEQVRKALKGDSKAYEVVRDSAGQKPVDKIQVAEVDADILMQVESMVMNDDD